MQIKLEMDEIVCLQGFKRESKIIQDLSKSENFTIRKLWKAGLLKSNGVIVYITEFGIEVLAAHLPYKMGGLRKYSTIK